MSNNHKLVDDTSALLLSQLNTSEVKSLFVQKGVCVDFEFILITNENSVVFFISN